MQEEYRREGSFFPLQTDAGREDEERENSLGQISVDKWETT
jgi:hypothetical protein